jgi:hypothetical protein
MDFGIQEATCRIQQILLIVGPNDEWILVSGTNKTRFAEAMLHHPHAGKIPN